MKTYLKSLSLANILLYFYWYKGARAGFDFPTNICRSEIICFLCLLIGLSGLIFLLLSSVKTSYVKLLFTGICVYIVIRGIKSFLHFALGINGYTLILFCAITCLFTVLGYLHYKKHLNITRALHHSLLFLSPFAFLTLTNLSLDVVSLSKPSALKPLQPVTKDRIVFLIFDELDENLVFNLRPAQHTFPHLDRFRNESIVCSAANQPGTQTMLSLPSLLIGKNALILSMSGASNLLLHTENKLKPVNLRKQTMIFDKAYENGFNSAFIGWYLPYDRLLLDRVSYFYQYSAQKSIKPQIWPSILQFRNQLSECLRFNFENLLLKVLGKSIFPKTTMPPTHLQSPQEKYEGLCQAISDVIQDKDLNFIFFHLPFPHYPTLYDPESQIIAEREPYYYNNVYLVDKLFAYIRSELERVGDWDSSTIIVSSDHWLRDQGFIDEYLAQEKQDFHDLLAKRNAPLVPLMIKAPFQKSQVYCNKNINARIAHDIIVSSMQGNSSDIASVIHKSLFCDPP